MSNHKWNNDICENCGLKRIQRFPTPQIGDARLYNIRKNAFIYQRDSLTSTHRPDCKEQPKLEVDLPFMSLKFKQVWGEWLMYRKQRRLPHYVPIGLQKTFTQLKNDSNNNEETAIAMIENSIAKNWQGIFKLPNQNNNGNSTKTGIYNHTSRIAVNIPEGQRKPL